MPEQTSSRAARWLDALVADARFALRYFARHKATTAIIVAVLALGTGANTLIFSLFQAEFFRPAPAMPEDATQVRVWAQERATPTARWRLREFTQPEIAALAARREVFRDVAAWVQTEVIVGSLADSIGARSVEAQFVTPNFFTVAGVGLSAGLGLRADAGDAADHSAVISHLLAEQLFGDAARAVGRHLLVNEVRIEVVGVAPPRFQGALKNMHEPAVFLPLTARADVERLSPRWLLEDPALSVIARLAPESSREQATAFAQQVVLNALPDSASRVGMARVADVLGLQDPPPGEARAEVILAFTLVMSIGVLILLVAWMNVGSLMVAAAVGRRHEIAVRLSLGASRLRLVRQLLTESTLLALVGGAAGLQMAWWVLTWMQNKEIDGVTIIPDAGTMLFVAAMALATGIVFGLSPALHATRDAVAGSLRDSGSGAGGRSRLQRGFVAAQVALSQPLLLMLGMTISMVVADYRPHAEEMARHVIRVAVRPIDRGSPEQGAEAVDRLTARIAQEPQVLAAVPEADGFDIRGLASQADSNPVIVHVQGTAPGWFHLVDVPVILGRDVSWADTSALDYPVVIGSDLARAMWGEANPIGRTLDSPPLPDFAQDSIKLTVVGVYDATHRLPGMSWGGETVKGVFSGELRAFTARGKHWRHDAILVRTRAPAAPYVTDLQNFIRIAAPSLPVTSASTIEQIDERRYEETLKMTAMAGVAGGVALALTALGLFGVVSLAVRQRTREIGVRIAVGAHPMQVARMFLRSGVAVSLVGLGIGLPLSVAGMRVAISQGAVIVPGVNLYAIGLVISAILVAVAAGATWLPASRAAATDPAQTLRAD